MHWDYQKILNEKFEPSYLESEDDLNRKGENMYKGNMYNASKILFQKGDRFMRVITRGSNYGVSAEYLTEQSFEEIVARSRDYDLGHGFIQQFRNDAAVKMVWNELPNMVLIYRLQQAAYGLVGTINWQWEDSKKSLLKVKVDSKEDDGRTGWYSAGKAKQVLFPHLSKKLKENLQQEARKRLDFVYDGCCASMVICGHKTLGTFIPNAYLKMG